MCKLKWLMLPMVLADTDTSFDGGGKHCDTRQVLPQYYPTSDVVQKPEYSSCGDCCCDQQSGRLDCQFTSDLRHLNHWQGDTQPTHLYLNHNNLEEIPFHLFNNNSEFREIWFVDNKIKSLDLDRLKSLAKSVKLLSFAYNSLHEISIPGIAFEELEILDLPGNDIQTIDPVFFTNVRKLKNLTISDNKLMRLKDFGFSSLEYLEELKLDSNLLTDITDKTFAGLNRLKHLDLSKNRLFQLKANQFQFTGGQLQELLISNNRIKVIDDDAFQGLSHLNILNLSGNQLVTMSPASFLPFQRVIRNPGEEPLFIQQLTDLDLTNNILTCGCENSDFLKWAQENVFVLKNFNEITCVESHHPEHGHTHDNHSNNIHQKLSQMEIKACDIELIGDNLIEMVIVPVSIVAGIILLAILTFCSRRCISVKSIAGSSRASFIDSSNGSKFESSIQNLNQLPTMSMLHYPHAPNHIPLELPPNQNMDQLHGDWAEKKSYPPLSSLRPNSNLESVQEETNPHHLRAQSCKPPNRHASPFDLSKSYMYSSSAHDLKNLPQPISKTRSLFDQGYGSGTIGSRSSNKLPNVFVNNGSPSQLSKTSKYSEKKSPMALANELRCREQSMPVFDRRDSHDSVTSHSSCNDSHCGKRKTSNSSDEIYCSKHTRKSDKSNLKHRKNAKKRKNRLESDDATTDFTATEDNRSSDSRSCSSSSDCSKTAYSYTTEDRYTCSETGDYTVSETAYSGKSSEDDERKNTVKRKKSVKRQESVKKPTQRRKSRIKLE